MKCEKCGAFISNVNLVCQNCINSNSTISSSNENNTDLNQTIIEIKRNRKIVTKILKFVFINIFLIALVYFFIINKPVFVFKSYINILKNKIFEENAPLGINISIKSNDKFIFNTDIYENSYENILFIDIDAIYNENEFFKANSLFDKKNAYIEFENVFDKYISYSSNHNIFWNEECINVSNSVFNAVKKSLKSDYFLKTKETININNNNKQVVANTIILNDSNYDEIIKKVAYRLKYDDVFLKNYSILSNSDIVDIIAKLNDIISGNLSFKTFEYKITLYTTNLNDLVGIKIVNNDNVLNIYFDDKTIRVFGLFDGIEIKIMDVNINDGIYSVMFYDKEDIYSFDIEVKVAENNFFTKPNVDNVIRVESLNKEDIDKILNKINNNDGIIELKNDYITVIDKLREQIEFYNNYRLNLFSQEILSLIDESKKQFLIDSSVNEDQNLVYTDIIGIPGKELFNKVFADYYVKFDKKGNIIKLVYYDKEYCYDKDELDIVDGIKNSDIVNHGVEDSYNGCGVKK